MEVIEKKANENGVKVATVRIHPAVDAVILNVPGDCLKEDASFAMKLACAALESLEIPNEWTQNAYLRYLSKPKEDTIPVKLLKCVHHNLCEELKLRFDYAIFYGPNKKGQYQKCRQFMEGKHLISKDFVDRNSNPKAAKTLTSEKIQQIHWRGLDPNTEVQTYRWVEEAIEHVKKISNETEGEIEVLITGSSHLDGGALSFLKPKDEIEEDTTTGNGRTGPSTVSGL
ncbi:Folylpolyglutamate synthetase [Aspergillus hancockii]|nr:Folylpolyglutamate synthetase [Aspergillus hancockii]